MNIMIVDDEFINRRFLETILQKYGECHIAEDGNGAVSMYKKIIKEGKTVDVIFLDIMMPKITGYEVLEKIREFEKNNLKKQSKIVVQTVAGDIENIEDAFEKGADSYLVKPIRKEDIDTEMNGFGIFPKNKEV